MSEALFGLGLLFAVAVLPLTGLPALSQSGLLLSCVCFGVWAVER